MREARKLVTFTLPRGGSLPLYCAPPSQEGHFWPFVTVEPTLKRWPVLSDKLVSAWTHYLAPRQAPLSGSTVPCTLELTGQCGLCEQDARRNWGAYLAVYSSVRDYQGPCILQITRRAVERCETFQGDTPVILPASAIETWREGRTRRAAMRCRVLPEQRGLVDLYERHQVSGADVLAQLFWIWGVRFQESNGTSASLPIKGTKEMV